MNTMELNVIYSDNIDCDFKAVQEFKARTVIVSKLPYFLGASSKLMHQPLSRNYTDCPYIIGSSNLNAVYSVNEAIKNNKKQVIFVVGNVGVGKTHFLEHSIQKMINLGKKVFYVSAIDLIDIFKKIYSKEKDEYDLYNMDVVVIDDIQSLNNKSYEKFYDTFFNYLKDWAINKLLIISSDNLPFSLKNFPERISSRFASGVTVYIDPPDEAMKRVFIRKYWEDQGMLFMLENQELNDFLLSLESFRLLKSALQSCQSNYEIKGFVDVDILKALYYTNPKDPIEKAVLIKNILKEHYGVIDIAEKKGHRKNNILAIIDSIVYYLLKDIPQVNKSALRDFLKIQRTNSTYYCNRGEKIFTQLPEGLKKQLKKIAEK